MSSSSVCWWWCGCHWQCIDLDTVDGIVRDVFERFDDGGKGHLSKDDFARWMKEQPEIDEVRMR